MWTRYPDSDSPVREVLVRPWTNFMQMYTSLPTPLLLMHYPTTSRSISDPLCHSPHSVLNRHK
jgi:hypothetical protein